MLRALSGRCLCCQWGLSTRHFATSSTAVTAPPTDLAASSSDPLKTKEVTERFGAGHFATKGYVVGKGGKKIVRPYVLRMTVVEMTRAGLAGFFATLRYRFLGAQRPYFPQDFAAMRFVNMRDIPSYRTNPGVRVEPSFVTQDEAAEIVPLLYELVAIRGVSLVDESDRQQFERDTQHLSHPHPLNDIQVSGRQRSPKKPPALWGSGPTFDITKVPAPLRVLVDRIAAHKGFRLGPCQDINITYRYDGCFFTPPYKPGEGLGSHFFTIGFVGHTVLTLIAPPRKLKFGEDPPPPRVTSEEQAMFSWGEDDIDILAHRHTLVYLSGTALKEWQLGIRLGIEPPEKTTLCDWWGDNSMIIARHAERFQVDIVFANIK
eukprot:gnl/Hemi2/24118_TR8095_c0_g1_i1.p1 gnl/Hemi2/24118_TR8095_c0_g1~~gnl/Hemi2/24118_TR8095_c0_g1_i1.p1  ORF type:complete len:375 (-),score=25.61 gnl/Hemi2/24118_TR8095_c0_g1_i1:52-1176(-)